MHRAGSDPANMTAEDFLCDFCLNHWAEDRPMVEGHRGGLICGECLTSAYRLLILQHGGTRVEPHVNCVLCLLHRDVEHWVSPRDSGVVLCRQCLELGIRTFERDPESGWTRPSE